MQEFYSCKFFTIFGHHSTGSVSVSAIRKSAGSGSALNQCGSTTLKKTKKTPPFNIASISAEGDVESLLRRRPEAGQAGGRRQHPLTLQLLLLHILLVLLMAHAQTKARAFHRLPPLAQQPLQPLRHGAKVGAGALRKIRRQAARLASGGGGGGGGGGLMADEDGARGLDERVVDGRDAASREVGGQFHGAEGGVEPAHQLAVGAGQAGPGAQVPPGRAGAPP